MTVNLKAFCGEVFEVGSLFEAQKISARAAVRMALVDLELPEWDAIHKRDRLVGCSLTGVQDAIGGLSDDSIEYVLSTLRTNANEAASKYASELRITSPLLVTTLKPEGCWTPEFTRVLDNGILFVDEIEPSVYDENGFHDVSGDYSVRGNRVSKVYTNDVKDILRITLKNNRALRITKSHPMSINGEWVKAEDVKIGDIIDYELGTYTSKKEVKLLPITDEMVGRRSDVRDYKTPKKMSSKLAYLIGAYFANGCFTTNDRIKYHCGHLELHEKVQGLWYKFFGIETNIIRLSDRDSYVQDFRSSKIRAWLNKNGIIKYGDDGEMIIPRVIRESSAESIIGFITGYADNDGCFFGKSFSIDSADEQFIRHVQEVGEAVGLCFGLSVNNASARMNSFSKKDMFKITLSRAFSNHDAIDMVNNMSVKAKMRGLVQYGTVKSKNPYTVTSIELEESQQTYDIEVENEHWYYQGGLKSHNTLSLVAGGVSPGVHDAHSPYFIRRIRISSDDALAKAAIVHGWNINPEVGTPENKIENAKTLVIDFPVKSGAHRTKDDVSALEQFNRYLTFQRLYTDHNTSNTITVRPEEWVDLGRAVKDAWDSFVGVSFLSLDGGTYQLAPYEAITKEEYAKALIKGMPFNPEILQMYESVGVSDLDSSDPDCATGGCPTR